MPFIGWGEHNRDNKANSIFSIDAFKFKANVVRANN